ncbi:MAG TPA: carbohydrate ABC transporter permease [Acetobacteraceae bacterium]|jgi:raffinose/stachyose/melibiose transport system permease protein|nr:carbohydrate ABC transporter permease [Acetobacteraceae bacterium]
MPDSVLVPAGTAAARPARARLRLRPGFFVMVATYAVLTVMACVILVPLLATLLGGFKSLGELRTNPIGPPTHWLWDNYLGILSTERYWRLLGNSMLIASMTCLLTLITASMAAFTFAHVRFFGRELLFNYLLLGLMFPAATAVLPLFIQIRDFGLLDTYWGVILPETAFGLAMSILLFRDFFRAVPPDLFEAAFVDGCGYIRFFLFMTLPLSRPILATVAIFTFVRSWNNYLLPLIMLNSDSRYPWPLGIMVYQGEYSTDWQLVLAFVTLTILPAVIVFFAAQKHIVAGLTAGAVKG